MLAPVSKNEREGEREGREKGRERGREREGERKRSHSRQPLLKGSTHPCFQSQHF